MSILGRALAILAITCAALAAALPIDQFVSSASVQVERISIAAPHTTGAAVLPHSYTLAVFTVNLNTSVAVRRASASSPSSRDAEQLHEEEEDRHVWEAVGKDKQREPFGVFRLTCGTRVFESFPLVGPRLPRAKRGLHGDHASLKPSPTAASTTADEALFGTETLVQDHYGPPVFLMPLPAASDSTSSTGEMSIALGGGHMVYDLLQTMLDGPEEEEEEEDQQQQRQQRRPGSSSSSGRRLRLALLLRYHQPSPVLLQRSAEDDDGADSSSGGGGGGGGVDGDKKQKQKKNKAKKRGHNHDEHLEQGLRDSVVSILSERMLGQCRLAVLSPEDQVLQPPAALVLAPASSSSSSASASSAAAASDAGASEALSGSVAFTRVPSIAASAAAAAVAAVDASASPSAAPALPPWSTNELLEASRFMVRQGHVRAEHLDDEFPAWLLASSSSLSSSAASSASVSVDPAGSSQQQQQQRRDAEEELSHASSAARSRRVSAVKCAFDASKDPIFLEDSAHTHHTVQAEVRGVIDGIIKPVGSFLGNLFNGVVGGSISASLGAAGVPGVTDNLTKQMMRALPPQLAITVPSSVAEIVRSQLPGPLARNIANFVTWTLSNRLTAYLSTHMAPVVARVTARKANIEVPKRVAVTVTKNLAHMLTRSITHAVVPSLYQTLERSPLRTSWCTACREHGQLCQYCWQNAENLHSAFYYSGYYSTYYSDYYAKYFNEYLLEFFAEAERKEMELERKRNQYQTVREM